MSVDKSLFAAVFSCKDGDVLLYSTGDIDDFETVSDYDFDSESFVSGFLENDLVTENNTDIDHELYEFENYDDSYITSVYGHRTLVSGITDPEVVLAEDYYSENSSIYVDSNLIDQDFDYTKGTVNNEQLTINNEQFSSLLATTPHEDLFFDNLSHESYMSYAEYADTSGELQLATDNWQLTTDH